MKKLLALLLALLLAGSLMIAAAETVRYGSTGDTVRSVQTQLRTLGYYTGRIDGIYGTQTQNAVLRYQQAAGLYADGIAGPKTQTALGLIGAGVVTTGVAQVSPLRYGATGVAVTQLQRALNSRGYYNVADGKYGDSTWVAVWRFQNDRGLAATGIADEQVLLQLGLVGMTPVIPVVPGTPVVSVGGTLKYGASGSQVYILQNALKARGFYPQAPNGVYDDATWRAVWLFQRAQNLSPDGIAGTATLQSLGLAGGVAVVPVVPVTPVAPATPSGTTLKYGSTGAPVYALQNALKSRGFYSQTPNGVYDDATWTAVWQYQRSQNISPDGIAGSVTMQKLGLNAPTAPSGQVGATSLKYGASGSAVSALQSSLKNLGYYTGTVDGHYGDSTFNAVWWFQKNNSLDPDGIAGAATISAINSGYAVRK